MKIIPLLLAAALSAAGASCGPARVEGLSLKLPGGAALDFYAEKAADSFPLGPKRTSTRLELKEDLPIPEGLELALLIEADGPVTARALARPAKRGEPWPLLAQLRTQASLAGSVEYRISLTPGAALAAVELSLDGASTAILRYAALDHAFIGWRAKGERGYPLVGWGVELLDARPDGVYALALTLPARDDASLALTLAARGELRVRSPAGLRAQAGQGWRAEAGPGSVVAFPSALFAGYRLEASASAAIERAWADYGRGAPLSDLHAMLAGPAPSGDYALYRWDVLPRTLVFDFKDYAVQDRYVKRLAFFAEKPNFRGRLPEDSEIAALHGWNAHDYAAKTLAAFYELARTSGFKLNREELKLLDLVLDAGIVIRESDGRLSEGLGAIISITREAPAWLRRTFMDHEAAHALFFQDPDYRALSERLWDTQSKEARQFWLEHLAWRHYDVSYKYLCYNELQAYITQQAPSRVRAYLSDNVIVRLSAAYPARAARYEADQMRILADADIAAAALDSYLRERWDLRAGAFGRARILP